jgi:hypothetical protein
MGFNSGLKGLTTTETPNITCLKLKQECGTTKYAHNSCNNTAKSIRFLSKQRNGLPEDGVTNTET